MDKTYARILTACFCLFLGGLMVWHLLLPDRGNKKRPGPGWDSGRNNFRGTT